MFETGTLYPAACNMHIWMIINCNYRAGILLMTTVVWTAQFEYIQHWRRFSGSRLKNADRRGKGWGDSAPSALTISVCENFDPIKRLKTVKYLLFFWRLLLGDRQKQLSGFFPLRGYPPPAPYPFSGKSFCQKKTLAKMGGTPPPPLTENRRKFSSKKGSKRAKIGVFWPKIAVF